MRIDGVEARHLKPASLAYLTLALALAGLAVLLVLRLLPFIPVDGGASIPGLIASVVVAGVLVFGAIGVSLPDMDGYCDNCGDALVLHDTRDERSSAYRFTVSKAPRRFEIGPLSIPMRTRRVERYYCSLECAQSDPLDVSAPAPDRQPVDDVSVEAEVGD